jgi:hypothetical protein
MKRLIFTLMALVLSVCYAAAQAPVLTMPFGTQTTNSSSTIAVTNTFQSIWTPPPGVAGTPGVATNAQGRSACTVQNNGINTMYVFFGPIASATLAKSIKLAAGQFVQCNVGGAVLQDQVSITGTSGDAFYAAQQ